MPISRVDKKTGAISFSATEEEKEIQGLQKENQDLLARLEALEKAVFAKKSAKKTGK